MREIKFRAWDEGAKRMFFNIQNLHYAFNFFDDTIPLMQYTGLKDKNGKEIYEGDIVKFKRQNGCYYIGQVIYETEYGTARYSFYTKTQLLDPYNMEIYGTTEWEVLGNIYENPELLKQKGDDNA